MHIITYIVHVKADCLADPTYAWGSNATKTTHPSCIT